MKSLKFLVLSFTLLALVFTLSYAQDTKLELSLDINSQTIPLPAIFKPNIDVSGRGFNRDALWPQSIAAKEVLDSWEKDIGFPGFYRLQYNLWEINQLAKNKDLQNKLLANYESVIKRISDAGGVVILDIFGTPAGMGKILDKKSPPANLKVFKGLVKSIMRSLSVEKKYNIWYEVWNAPDIDDFFLGRKQDYFNLYRVVAEAKMELELEAKVKIPVGGPSTSWWFQDIQGNTIASPENSLIYGLIKFCYRYHLPLDFITWHAYSTDPAVEKATTVYKKDPIVLIRDWLSYFNFGKNTPLLVDEWNFDPNVNFSVERQEKSFVAASFIISRLKNMYEAGLDNQVYFCLEDFKNNKEGVSRNVGAFTYELNGPSYKGSPKAVYNIYWMLSGLGSAMYPVKLEDVFVGALATKTDDGLVMLVYNYIDPDIAANYLSRNIGTLSNSEKKLLIRILKSDKWNKLLEGKLDIAKLSATKKMKNLIREALALNEGAKKHLNSERAIDLSIKNLKGSHLYRRYAVDSSCGIACDFTTKDEKEVAIEGVYQESLSLKPYSVQMIIFKKKAEIPKPEVSPAAEKPQ
jgi:hypothetical protein